MFNKIKWEQEWLLCAKTIQIVDESQPITLRLNKNEYRFNTTGDFYGFANISMLIGAHVIPNKLLKFKVKSLISDACKTTVTIEKLNGNEYRVKVYSPEVLAHGFYFPEKNIVETLTKEELETKLSLIIATFDEFPLLTLPFGNCFSI